MFRNQMGIIAAMESADNEGVDLNEVESAETATAVSEDTAAMTTEATGIDAEAAQIGDAVESGEQLEEIAEVAVDAVESGEGMDETAAAMASIAIENIRNRLGFRGQQKLVPALESFGNTNTKLVSTRLVIEGIGDTLKSIWAAIKAAAIRLWDKIKSFFASLFNSATMLSKHIASLKERARAIPSSAVPKEKMIKAAGLAKAINVGGKANGDTLSTISKNTLSLTAVCALISNKSGEIVDEVGSIAKKEINEQSMKKYLALQTNATDVVEKALKDSFSVADKTFSSSRLNAIYKVKQPKKGSSITRAGYGPFIGSTIMTMEIESANNEKKYTFSISGVPADAKMADEVEALDLQGINAALEIASSNIHKLIDFKKTQSNMDTITKAVNNVADTVMKESQKILSKTGSSSKTREDLAEMKSTVSNAISDMQTLGSRAPSMAFALCKYAADYASISMRNLGEKAKKD